MRFSSASPLASLPWTSVPGGSTRPSSTRRLVVLVGPAGGPLAELDELPQPTTSAATHEPRPPAVQVARASARGMRGHVAYSTRRARRDGERPPASRTFGRTSSRNAGGPARPRRRTRRRARPARRAARVRAAMTRPTPAASTRSRAERDRGERDERRDQEHEAALVADVVHEQLERAERRPTAAAAARPAQRSRQRASSRTRRGPTDQRPNHMRVKQSWRTGNQVTRSSSDCRS